MLIPRGAISKAAVFFYPLCGWRRRHSGMRMRRIQIQKARKHSILQQGKKSICPVCGAGLSLRGRVRASSFKSLPTSASVPPSTTTPDPLLEQRDRQAGGETVSRGLCRSVDHAWIAAAAFLSPIHAIMTDGDGETSFPLPRSPVTPLESWEVALLSHTYP